MSDKRNPTPVSGVPIGGIIDWPGPIIPQLWLESRAQSVLRATYASLFGALNVPHSGVTITNASPAVFTFAAHNLVIGDPVFFETTGALPTGLTADQTYYVMTVPTSSTFTVGTTRTINVTTGIVSVTTAVNTSSAGSGTHTLWYSPYEVADSTHFYLPDFRGRTAIGKDDLGGAVIPWSNVLGLRAGEGTHTLLVAELASHAHTVHASTGGAVVANLLGFKAGTNDINFTSDTAGGDTAHNTMQPGIIVRKIIYAGVV